MTKRQIYFACILTSLQIVFVAFFGAGFPLLPRFACDCGNYAKFASAMLEADIHSILKRYWGYDTFRPLQEDIINSVLSGRDTLALMPTGGGKSVTFQVPALAMDGICIVITPLIALMEDQVQNLRRIDIKAAHVHSGMSRSEIGTTLENCIYGNYKLLYISPERISSDIFAEKLKLMRVSMIVVDEAHCISQWGYDFRPAYMNIGELRKLLPGKPVLALTATATPEVAKDIQKNLLFKEENVFKTSFARHNIAYVVRKADNKTSELVRILKKVPGSAIVYVRNRRRCKEIASELQEYDISADYFHAGLDSHVKREKQQLWKNGACRVIVATNAFGMGIDKPDVRLVAHIDLPNSPEEYFQEAGRCGRDGKKAYAVALYSDKDKLILRKRISDSFPDKEFIRNVYESLCNYLQIAVGFGDGSMYDFEINNFGERYGYPLLPLYNALKILELCGYIEYVENVDTAARLMIITDREELYRWSPTDPTDETVLECVMRSYSGLFTEYSPIQPDVIARRTGLTVDEVYKSLVSISKQKIIHYIPRKQTPYIYFTAPREEQKYVAIPKNVYEERKERFTDRIEMMILYATHDKKCRQQILLEYFGEKGSRPCGMCDNCLKKESDEITEREFAEILHAIKIAIAKRPMSAKEIAEELPYKTDNVIEVIRFLEDEGYIGKNKDNRYTLPH